MAEFAEAFTSALAASEPTLIVVEESAEPRAEAGVGARDATERL